MTAISDLPPEVRARHYLDLAEDARRSAAACKGELHKQYLFLAEQWEKLASEMSDYYLNKRRAKD